jgi:cytoskeletal protein CcmA (bactofilin family)
MGKLLGWCKIGSCGSIGENGDGNGFTAVRKRGEEKLWRRFSHKEKHTLSFIGEGITVVGSMDFGDGEVRLDGRLEGKILGQGTLIIGEKGSLQGEVDVGALVLHGRVASDSIRITRTGRLCGRLYAVRFVMEEGGIFEGESEPYSVPAKSSGASLNPSDRR